MMRRRAKTRIAASILFEEQRVRPMSKMARLVSLLVVVIWLTGAIAGCQPRTNRLPVSGAITLNGQPLDGATIRFTSIDGVKSANGALVQAGRFQIPKAKGLLPGKYHVEINAPDDKAPQVLVGAGPGQPGIRTAPERVPDEYNIKSKQTIEVKTGGDNNFTFDIVSGVNKKM
jgi:hypothetical protein